MPADMFGGSGSEATTVSYGDRTLPILIVYLPVEILTTILRELPSRSLRAVSLTCRDLRPHALALIWHTVELRDKCSSRRDPEKHRYQSLESPEHDPDASLLPGVPLRFGPAALRVDNPRGPERPFQPQDVPLLPNPHDPLEIAYQMRTNRDARYSLLSGCVNVLGLDQHNDAPMIRKLYLLAKNPDLAAYVRVLKHRCHLPMPEMSGEPIKMCTGGQTLSSDWRTMALLKLAILNMKCVHTLRFANPHWNIYRVMMCDFFDRNRIKHLPIKRLWLESCSAAWDSWPATCDFSTLESIRLRRSNLGNDCPLVLGELEGEIYPPFYFARSGPPVAIRNGLGGIFFTATHTIQQEHECKPHISQLDDNNTFSHVNKCPPDRNCPNRCSIATIFDDEIYSTLPEVDDLLRSKNGECHCSAGIDMKNSTCNPEHDSTGRSLLRWLSTACANLTHLNLDWLILRKRPSNFGTVGNAFWFGPAERVMFAALANLRFKNLRSFQVRNAVSPGTVLPPEVFLLSPTKVKLNNDVNFEVTIDFLSFLAAHPNIKALAWPMDAFLQTELWNEGRPKTAGQVARAQHAEKVLDTLYRLGRTLETLRLDVFFVTSGVGEPHTDSSAENGWASRQQRAHFIKNVAPQMRSIKTLKMEGYIPRDEKRETLRAMSACPLERLIWIGRTFPLGNTWGEDAQTLEHLEGESWLGQFWDSFQAEVVADMESVEGLPMPRIEEHETSSNDSITNEQISGLDETQGNNVPQNGARLEISDWETGIRLDKFNPRWGWKNMEPPLLYAVAHNFAATITELKFCGYNGSIIYERNKSERANNSLHPDVTPVILHHLKHFHRLKNLVVSFYIMRDVKYLEDDIILTWLCARDALWEGKEEDCWEEEPNSENTPTHWNDIGDNEAGEVNRQELVQVLGKYGQHKLVTKALRRAFIWDKHWSIKSSIMPFPAFPDYELYQESQQQQEQERLLRGRLAGIFGAPGGQWGVNRLENLPNDEDHLVNEDDLESHGPTIQEVDETRSSSRFEKLKFDLAIDELPLPSVIFSPFIHSHSFYQWYRSPFLRSPTQPGEVSFFWNHISDSLHLLESRFSPRVMAESIHAQLNPYLSSRAIRRGINVRSSFCMGTDSSDVFDLDVLIDGQGVRRWWGPRPEIDPGRWKQKTDGRKYF